MYIEGEVTIVKKFVKAIVCDCCKTEYRDDFELQEFLHFLNKGGYSSIFGDGVIVRLDLCQYCVKKLLGEYLYNEEDSDGRIRM
jgi:hypothetical protein